MEINVMAGVRRANLQRVVSTILENNQSRLAELCNPDSPNPSYYNELLRNPKKAFGEKSARRIEAAVGLLIGQLDIPNSPLTMDPRRSQATKPDIEEVVGDLTPSELEHLVAFAMEIKSRRKKRAGRTR
jgi:hypothetical protein